MGDGGLIRFHTTRSKWDGGVSTSSARAERAQQQNHLMYCRGSASVEKEALDGSSSPDTLPDTRPGLALQHARAHISECCSCLALSNTCCAFAAQRLSPDTLALLFSSGQSRRERVLEAIGAYAHEQLSSRARHSGACPASNGERLGGLGFQFPILCLQRCIFPAQGRDFFFLRPLSIAKPERRRLLRLLDKVDRTLLYI